ncbi:MAG: phosphatidate cytidylyltransferase [Micrococcales bacterium]|nr:phosphatidate cytidylyltransferase [Micrococcales bacterium]
MSTTSPGSPPKVPSRAGRDLKAAIAVGVGLGALIIATLMINTALFLVVIMLAISVAVWEIREALRNAAVVAPLIPVLIGTVGMLWAAYVYGPAALLLAWCLTMAATVVWRAAGPIDRAGRDTLGGIFAATYPPLLAGFAALLLAPEDGAARAFVFLIIAVCSDIGGYAVGVLFGKHPMAPSISPKKSWEGLSGSVLLCVVAGAVTVPVFLGRAWWIGVLLGVAVALCATIGDLMESVVKRDLGVKDMSNILPGHGGLMDRLDSLLVVAPVVWAVLTLLAPPVA